MARTSDLQDFNRGVSVVKGATYLWQPCLVRGNHLWQPHSVWGNRLWGDHPWNYRPFIKPFTLKTPLLNTKLTFRKCKQFGLVSLIINIYKLVIYVESNFLAIAIYLHKIPQDSRKLEMHARIVYNKVYNVIIL